MPTDRHPDSQRLPLAHPRRFAPHEDPTHDAILRWEARVDAARAARPPADPAIMANLLATDALFRRIALGRRAR